MAIRVFVVNGHDEIRRLFMAWLEREEGIQVVGDVRDAAEAIDALGKMSVDVLLLDIDVSDRQAIAAIRTAREAFPKLRIVGMTWDPLPDRVVMMMDAGVRAVFDKASKLDGLVRVIAKCFE